MMTGVFILNDLVRQGRIRRWSAVQAALNDRQVIELCLPDGHYQGLATALGGLGIQVKGRYKAQPET